MDGGTHARQTLWVGAGGRSGCAFEVWVLCCARRPTKIRGEGSRVETSCGRLKGLTRSENARIEVAVNKESANLGSLSFSSHVPPQRCGLSHVTQ